MAGPRLRLARAPVHRDRWNLLALADLGASRAIPELQRFAERWMTNSPLEGGGVGGFGKGKGHYCDTANMARGLIRLE